jgi:hypothetical protein
VANAASYHAQYQFVGRLEKPLAELQGEELSRWLVAHPEGYVVIYLRNGQNADRITARHKQAYRGRTAVLVAAPEAARLLAASSDD